MTTNAQEEKGETGELLAESTHTESAIAYDSGVAPAAAALLSFPTAFQSYHSLAQAICHGIGCGADVRAQHLFRTCAAFCLPVSAQLGQYVGFVRFNFVIVDIVVTNKV